MHALGAFDGVYTQPLPKQHLGDDSFHLRRERGLDDGGAGEARAVGDDAREREVDDLVREVMRIERRFAYESRNVQADRRDGVRQAVEDAVGRRR